MKDKDKSKINARREKDSDLPEHDMVSGRMRRHGVPDILVDLCPVIEGLHYTALQQVLIPVSLLSQHPGQNLFGSCGNLHRYFPQPQWIPVMDLEKQTARPSYFTCSPLI